MREGNGPQERSTVPEYNDGHSGLVFILVAIALLLAIAFFYLTNEDREAGTASAITDAAETADKAVTDAARNATNIANKFGRKSF